MSRTNKDKPSKIIHPEYYDHVAAATKKKREHEGWYWMSTPSWWTNITFTRKQRRMFRLLERLAVLAEDLEEIDFKDTKNKPKKYYW